MLNLPTGSNVVKTTISQVPPAGYTPGPNLISPREYEVLQLLLAGNSGREMSIKLDISEKTVKFHKTNLFIKYGVESATSLFAKLLAEKDEQIRQLKLSNNVRP